jgi:hypothetical protein
MHPLVVRDVPENLKIGLPALGIQCEGVHIGGAKMIRSDS